ncbi:MAG TPA: triose-phosphate isomerase [Rhizomicrobium sp.]|nr:triose-phosphate isomerase [Rhizomicrobium sp.]
MRSLVAGNWKMNGLGASLGELSALKEALAKTPAACEVLVCPPATLIAQAAWTVKGAFALGGQDCHAEAKGAFTGDISAEMLKDAGASYVIAGHSERRQYHGESDAAVAAKAKAAWRAGLKVIICVGESLAERDAGTATHICQGQLNGSVPDGATSANTVIAYEPVWAIGTGRTPTAADIAAMHAHIRGCLKAKLGEGTERILILYGGSVNPGNAAEILALPEVGGALVGGASLKAADFLKIIASIPAAS